MAFRSGEGRKHMETRVSGKHEQEKEPEWKPAAVASAVLAEVQQAHRNNLPLRPRLLADLFPGLKRQHRISESLLPGHVFRSLNITHCASEVGSRRACLLPCWHYASSAGRAVLDSAGILKAL